MLAGILGSIGHFVLYRLGYLHYGSDLEMDFRGGFYGFMINLMVALLISCFEKPRPPEELKGLVYWDVPRPPQESRGFYRTPSALAIGAAILVVALNIIFW